MLPWPDRIGVEPTPHRAVADAGDQPELSRLLRHVGHTKARQRRTHCRRQFTCQRLDLHHHVWGKKPGAGLGALDLPTRPGVPGKSACATSSHSRAAYARSPQSRRCPTPGLPAGSSWPGRPDNTATYISRRDGLARAPRRVTARSEMDCSLEWRASVPATLPQAVAIGNTIIRVRIYEIEH